jgi:SAM-dependent methyltransferase
MMDGLKNIFRFILPSAAYERLVLFHWRQKNRKSGSEFRNVNNSEYWNRVWAQEGLGTRDEDGLHQAILEQVPDGSRVIDVGCGNGQLIRKLISGKRCLCTGLDISDVVLAAMRQDLGIETIHAVLPKIPAPEEAYDVAICSECLEHLDQPAETVSEMHRIVREGGRLVITVPDGYLWGKGGEHVQAFAPTDCVNLLRPHVRQVNLRTLVDHAGWPYLVAWGERCRESSRYADPIVQAHKCRKPEARCP